MSDVPSKDFSRGKRLLRPADYKHVFDHTTVKSQTKDILILGASSLEGGPRLGLVISKKSAKRAVDRNRLKRIIRESFRHHQGRIKSYDLVVLSRPGAKELSKEELRATLDRLWYKLKPVGSGGKSRSKRKS